MSAANHNDNMSDDNTRPHGEEPDHEEDGNTAQLTSREVAATARATQQTSSITFDLWKSSDGDGDLSLNQTPLLVELGTVTHLNKYTFFKVVPRHRFYSDRTCGIAYQVGTTVKGAFGRSNHMVPDFATDGNPSHKRVNRGLPSITNHGRLVCAGGGYFYNGDPKYGVNSAKYESVLWNRMAKGETSLVDVDLEDEAATRKYLGLLKTKNKRSANTDGQKAGQDGSTPPNTGTAVLDSDQDSASKRLKLTPKPIGVQAGDKSGLPRSTSLNNSVARQPSAEKKLPLPFTPGNRSSGSLEITPGRSQIPTAPGAHSSGFVTKTLLARKYGTPTPSSRNPQPSAQVNQQQNSTFGVRRSELVDEIIDLRQRTGLQQATIDGLETANRQLESTSQSQVVENTQLRAQITALERKITSSKTLVLDAADEIAAAQQRYNKLDELYQTALHKEPDKVATFKQHRDTLVGLASHMFQVISAVAVKLETLQQPSEMPSEVGDTTSTKRLIDSISTVVRTLADVVREVVRLPPITQRLLLGEAVLTSRKTDYPFDMYMDFEESEVEAGSEQAELEDSVGDSNQPLRDLLASGSTENEKIIYKTRASKDAKDTTVEEASQEDAIVDKACPEDTIVEEASQEDAIVDEARQEHINNAGASKDQEDAMVEKAGQQLDNLELVNNNNLDKVDSSNANNPEPEPSLFVTQNNSENGDTEMTGNEATELPVSTLEDAKLEQALQEDDVVNN